jgi:hypothetical protein
MLAKRRPERPGQSDGLRRRRRWAPEPAVWNDRTPDAVPEDQPNVVNQDKFRLDVVATACWP